MVGYDMKIGAPDVINSAIDRFNSENPKFTKKMRKPWNSSGFVIGTRYKLGNLSLEGHYIPSFKNLLAETEVADEVFKKHMKINQRAIGGSAIISIKQIGAGLAWYQHSYRISHKFDSDKKYINGLTEPLRFQTLNLFLDFSNELNESMKVHFRPYYQLPLRGDRLTQGQADANLLMSPRTDAGAKNTWGAFGFQIIVANGTQ